MMQCDVKSSSDFNTVMSKFPFGPADLGERLDPKYGHAEFHVSPPRLDPAIQRIHGAWFGNG